MTYQVFDTTLRDGAQREGITYSVVDKLAVARLLDEFGVGFIEGGWPGAMPKDTEFFRRARTELDLQARAAGRVRRDPQGRRRGRRRPAGAGAARRRDPGGLPGRQVRRPARRAGAAHHRARRTWPWSRDTVRVPASPRAAGSSSTASTSSTASASTPTYTASVVATALEAGAERRRACATPTAACCPRMITAADRRRLAGADSASSAGPARHPLPERHRLRGRQHRRRGRGGRTALPVHRQRLRRAARQRRPLRRRGQPPAQARAARPTGRLPGTDGAGLPRHRRDRQHRPRHPPGLRRGRRLRSQGGAARERDQGGSGALQPRRPGRRRQRHEDPGDRDGRPGQHRAQEPRARAGPGRPSGHAVPGHQAGQGAGGGAAGRSRPPTPRSSCWCATSCGEPRRRRSRWSPTGCIVEHREDGAVVSEATVKVRVRGERVIATAEGNGPVNALDEALRVALARHYPELAGFELADYKVRILEGSHGTGAITRVLVETARRRRPRLDHGRRARERGRGELARPGRRARLRPADHAPGA